MSIVHRQEIVYTKFIKDKVKTLSVHSRVTLKYKW